MKHIRDREYRYRVKLTSKKVALSMGSQAPLKPSMENIPLFLKLMVKVEKYFSPIPDGMGLWLNTSPIVIITRTMGKVGAQNKGFWPIKKRIEHR